MTVSNDTFNFSKNFRKNHPKLEEKKNGQEVRLMNNCVDPFIRDLVGDSIPSDLQLLLKLLEMGALDEKTSIPNDELTRNETKLFNELIQSEHVHLTGDIRIYLTRRGTMVAKGAQKLYL